MGTFLPPVPTATHAGAWGTESPRVQPGAQGCPQPLRLLPHPGPPRPPPPRLTRRVREGVGAPPSRPRRRRQQHHGPRAAAAPGPLAGRALFLLQTFGFCGRQETGATLSKSSRCRLGGSGEGGMSEQLKGRHRGRRAQRTRERGGKRPAGNPCRIPRPGNGPSAAEHLAGISQSCNNKKEGAGRGGLGRRSGREVWSYNCLFSPYSQRAGAARVEVGVVCRQHFRSKHLRWELATLFLGAELPGARVPPPLSGDRDGGHNRWGGRLAKDRKEKESKFPIPAVSGEEKSRRRRRQRLTATLRRPANSRAPGAAAAVSAESARRPGSPAPPSPLCRRERSSGGRRRGEGRGASAAGRGERTR